MFYILIPINIKVLLILRTKSQPNKSSCSGEIDCFISFAIVSNGDHLEFSTVLNYSEALESDHADYEI